MTRPRTTTSPSDALGATISDSKSRLINLEALAHRHDQPSSSLGPVGTIVDYIGTTAPTGWAIMDGSTITNGQTLYPALWAILPLGFKFGTSIILPDTRGRVTVGRNPSDTDFDTIGELRGSKTVTLTTAQMPSHNHGGVTSLNAYTNFLRLVAAVGTTMENNHMVGRGGGSFADYSGSFPNHQHDIPSEGGGGAHDNVQPSIVFSKIIKLV